VRPVSRERLLLAAAGRLSARELILRYFDDSFFIAMQAIERSPQPAVAPEGVRVKRLTPRRQRAVNYITIPPVAIITHSAAISPMTRSAQPTVQATAISF